MILTASAISAHHFAGGDLIRLSSFFIYFALVVSVTKLSMTSITDGPKLALLIIFVQSTTHFILGSGSSSDAQMGISHLLMGVISYYAILLAEDFLDAVIDLWIGSLTLKPIILRSRKIGIYIDQPSTAKSFNLFAIQTRRGPPVHA